MCVRVLANEWLNQPGAAAPFFLIFPRILWEPIPHMTVEKVVVKLLLWI